MNGRTVNRSECAEIFGVRDGTISKWVDAGMPFVSRPATKGQEWSFNTKAVSEWLQERAVKAAVGDPSKADTIELKRRKLKAEAEMAELEADRKMRLLVPVDLAVKVFGSQLEVIKVKLDALPVRAAPLVANQTNLNYIQRLLHKFVEEIKADLRDYGQELVRRDRESGEEPSRRGVRP